MKLSPEELSNGKLNAETLAGAVNQIRLNGYVLFEGVLDSQFIDEMNKIFLAKLEQKMQDNPEEVFATQVNKAFRKNRARMYLPFEEPFINPQVILNPFVMPIVEELLGEDLCSFYLAADAPFPGSDYQIVHSDQQALYPDSDVTLPPTGIVVNIPLVDITEENGPMDMYPGGTHLMPEKLNKPSYIQETAEHMTPIRGIMPKGSLLIRDLRMWHRGTPNNSDQIRPNVAVIYAKHWWEGSYFQKSLGITKEKYDALPERAQRMYRNAKIEESTSVKAEVK